MGKPPKGTTVIGASPLGQMMEHGMSGMTPEGRPNTAPARDLGPVPRRFGHEKGMRTTTSLYVPSKGFAMSR